MNHVEAVFEWKRLDEFLKGLLVPFERKIV